MLWCNLLQVMPPDPVSRTAMAHLGGLYHRLGALGLWGPTEIDHAWWHTNTHNSTWVLSEHSGLKVVLAPHHSVKEIRAQTHGSDTRADWTEPLAHMAAHFRC